MRNFTAVKAGKGGTGDYAEYLLKEEALKKSSEYYVEGETTATTSVYIGSKSAKLGLSGEISLEAAQELLAGYLPDGTRIRGEKTSGEEILAHDNTLSAPKSVSIHCADDMRLLDCHINAVQQTIAALEKHYCVQRVQKDGIRTLEKGDGFVGWMTHHWTSREGEIDLHTHVMTMNGCMGPDGKWRAVEDHQMSKALWIGSIYRNYLAQQVQGIGYKIREKKIEGKGYSFELEGYTDQHIEEFSTRHKQISEAKKKGLGDQEAWYTTRKGKEEEISLGELFEKTIAKKAEIGCTGQSFPMSMNTAPIGKTNAKALVNNAIAHLSRGSCRFSQADILAQAFDHMERVKLKEVEQEISTHPELVDYGVIRGIDELKGQYTTAATLERETRIIKRWMRGQGQATPIMDKAKSAEAITRLEVTYKTEWQQSHDSKLQELRAKIADGDKSKRTAKKLQRLEKEEFEGLNKGQLGAVQGILASDNNNAIVYGLSGVGKTKSLRPTKDILDELGIDTVWLAPSLPAVEILSEDVGKQAYTLQRLAYTDSIKLKPGQIVFIDEFGLADAECMDLASAKAEAAGARLIGIGDHKQNQPIQAGSPMRSLMDHGAEVFKISEILRQQDPIQKRAVELIAEGKGVESLALLSEHGYVREIQDPEQRQDAIAAQYLSMPVPDQKNTLVITGTNAERLALTEKIRQGQKDAGILGESLDCIQLEDSRLTPEQLTDLRNYAIGDYVAPVRDYAKVKRHEFCKIIGKTDDHLILELPSGTTFELDANRWDKKKYTAGSINVAAGDELRFRGKINGKDFENGQIFTVKEIEGTIATLQGKKGKTRTIDLSRPVPIDHNIVRTTFDVQGSGKEGAILSLTDDRTSNQGSTYVGISRHFDWLSIYTQDYDALLKRVSQECTGDNALDLLEVFDYGNSADHRPEVGLDSETKRIDSITESGATRTKPGTQSISERGNEHSPDHSEGRDGHVSDPVRGATGEPEALGNGGRDSGIDRDTQGLERPSDELGTDAWRDVLPSELRSRRDQELHPEAAQQRLDESAANLRRCMERVISSLSVLGNDELVHESGLVQNTREVVEALEPIVSSLEGQPAPNPPKRDLSAAMARVINGLTAVDSEKVFSDSVIVAEIKSLVSRVEAHTIAQEQLTNQTGVNHDPIHSHSPSARANENLEQIGEQYVRSNNSSESTRVSRDPKRSRNLPPNRTGADFERSTSAISENRRTIGEDGQLTRISRGSAQTLNDAERGQERYVLTPRESREGHRAEPRDANQSNEITGSNGSEARQTDSLQRIADTIVRVRLQRELAEPMARLQAQLDALATIEKLNQEKQASISAKLERYLSQAKVEVLDTTLTEWRSLRQEPELELPEAIAIPDRVALTELIENYPAQKVVEFAMAEYAKTRDQVIDFTASVKTGVPVFKLEKSEHSTKTVDPPKLKVRSPSAGVDRPVTLKRRLELNNNPKPKPTKLETFWVPEYQVSDRPHYIEPHHWKEMEKSAIHPQLIRENIISISGQSVIERLLEHEFEKPKYGAGQEVTAPMIEKLNDYATLEKGGWWGSAGTDAKSLLTDNPQQSSSGVFKGDSPRVRVEPILKFKKLEHNFVSLKDGFTNVAWSEAKRSPNDHLKYKDYQDLLNAEAMLSLLAVGINPNKFIKYEKIKYENPAGTDRPVFLANVPPNLAQKIYANHGITPTEEELEQNFWQVVRDRNLPILLIEGDKKALAALSQGVIAVGTPGVALYRSNIKNEDGTKTKLEKRELLEAIAVFATPGRIITIANDQDPPSKTKTIWNVRRDTVRSAELLDDAGCDVRVATWDYRKGKGADDLIANHGGAEFLKAIATAGSWTSEAQIWYRAQYKKLVKTARQELGSSVDRSIIDRRVYQLAVEKGDSTDGDRTLSRSDYVLSLDSTEQVKAYIEQIKTAEPEKQEDQPPLAATADKGNQGDEIEAQAATPLPDDEIIHGVAILIHQPDAEVDEDSYLFRGERWTVRLDKNALTITRNIDNTISYQVKYGVVTHRIDEDELRQAMRSIIASRNYSESTQSISRTRAR